MSPSDITLLERWQDRRDAKAFQELVSRHGGMVYAACSRILRNAADAEEVAQECFLALAQAKAHNIRLLGGWLHTFATHRSLDRVRADKRRQQRERRYAGAARAHVDATWNEIQHFVDEAIASLPEQLSCVVVGHFLEGRSQADLAQSLNLSPSAVSRRIDRAVELLRSSLHKRGLTVGLALLPGMLAEAASAAIPKSLVAALGKLALSGLRRVQPAATSTIAAGLLKPIAVKSGLAVLALAMIAALGFRFIGQPPSDVPDNRIVTSEPTSLAGSGPVQAASAQQSPSNFIAQPEIAQVSAQAQTNASVSGVVIYHDNGQPAEGMRVLLGTMNGQSNETLTDAQGAFAFNDLAPEEVVLLAYDARYDEVPEDWLRSEHVELSLVEGEAKTDIRIEVPLRGGQVGGRVVDKKTGVPLAGIVIDASRVGVGSYTAKTGRDGR
ncbi:MAG: sigma-70 family RNA polymerase sigma factor, partial [Candidatus Hydrogenedentes bacterium]|nr:sigma-70 family RNA polymerase sigma factor [Candidatus Hydrogenedentota bacterium]